MPYADPYIDYDGPYTPYSPSSGDAIIWWNPNGTTKHSVTIVGSWNGLSTLVMSKNGQCGQYRSALSNPIGIYGTNWAVTRFGAGTTIYSGIQVGEVQVEEGREDSASTLLDSRKDTSWFDAVQESEVWYAVERPRYLASVGGISDDSYIRFSSAESNEERIAILVQDLEDPAHYTPLPAYNDPLFGEEFIFSIEAGKALVRISEKVESLRPLILKSLRDIVFHDFGAPDGVRGAAIYFSAEMMEPEEVREFLQQIQDEALIQDKSAAETRNSGRLLTYDEHFVDLLQRKVQSYENLK